MAATAVGTSGFRTRVRSGFSPLPAGIPAAIRDQLILLQHRRLHRLTPFLFLTIAANAIAMGLAVMGDLPLWQQLTPPAILVTLSLVQVALWRRQPREATPDAALSALGSSMLLAGFMGLVSGVWSVSAFSETEKYYCIVAPVFLSLASLVSANCLASVPRAATAAMVGALTPMVAVMLLFDNLGIRAMGVMLIVIFGLNFALIRTRFRETIQMLELQNEIATLADTDALTGLGNRRAFTRQIEAELEARTRPTIAVIDLDGFKAANDAYGHHAGDAILIEVGARLRTLCPDAAVIARLGGDEFAILFALGTTLDQAEEQSTAMRSLLAMPYQVDGETIAISASAGLARAGDTSADLAELLRVADVRLYSEKATRRKIPVMRAAA